MKLLRLAVATQSFRRPLKSAILLASQFGAQGVQFDIRNELKPSDLSATGRRELLHRLEELGLKVASFHFPTSRPLADPDRLDARIDAIKKAMEFAYQMGARTLTARLGAAPDESDQFGRSQLLGILDDLAQYSNRVGVTLALGPGRESPARLVPLFREVTQGPIGIDFDPATALQRSESSAERVRAFGTLVTHLVARDGVLDSEGAVREVPVGRGEVSWDEFLATLEEIGYRGWLTVDRTQGDDRAGDIARAVEYLKSVAQG